MDEPIRRKPVSPVPGPGEKVHAEGSPGESGLSPGEQVLRFSLGQRVQHIILFSSLLVLALTGFSLKFSENPVAKTMIGLEGGIELRGLIHRIAAGILIVLAIYHFLRVLFAEEDHKEFMCLRLAGRDFRNSIEGLKYTLGLSKERPLYDRFTGIQKLQYWGVVVGAAIMIFTGLLLWFPSEAMAVMPKWLMDITFIVHGYQGTLVFLVLFLWHLYNVHIGREKPFRNNTWITGKISASELKTIHPVEYERLVAHGEIREE